MFMRNEGGPLRFLLDGGEFFISLLFLKNLQRPVELHKHQRFSCLVRTRKGLDRIRPHTVTKVAK